MCNNEIVESHVVKITRGQTHLIVSCRSNKIEIMHNDKPLCCEETKVETKQTT